MNANHEVLFVSHGGGPLPLLGDAQHHELVIQLTNITQRLRKPSAILVISAHWETDQVTVTSGATSSLLYDYYNFPPESYKIQYPAPGSEPLSQSVVEVLTANGIQVNSDAERGLDHGVFVPLKLMYPEADIPVVQLSLKANLNPSEHIAIGKALQNVDTENLLIIGSGFSFHNMRAFANPNDADIERRNLAFENWLKTTIRSSEITEPDREQRLIHWDRAPEARFCHPREEHLLPLHVCYGATQKPADYYSMARTLGRTAGLFHWRA